MENFSYHDVPPGTRVLAPYAGQLIVGFQGQAKRIPEDVKKDPSSLDAFFQNFHDIAHGLLSDGEFNHSDLLQVREGIDALRQHVMTQIMMDLSKGVPEVALEAA